VAWPAPAKLNLFLHVLGRRPDGYHEIQTLFQLIDLNDELRFEVDDSGAVSRGEVTYEVGATQDLVTRAAVLLQARTRTKQGVRISVTKRVPLGAGLGGGSSDAATTLLVLNELWKCRLSRDELAELALSLGADVPVFVYGHSALAAGVGERLQPVDLGPRHYVLVFSGKSISTAEIFGSPDLPRHSRMISLDEAIAGAGRNDCEAVARGKYPDLDALFAELEAWGQPRLTGTGGAVFLPMPDEKAAQEATREMKCRYNVRAVRGVDRSPVHEMMDVIFR
jgi:4-diphosphocytidyl-2-C-methyl-D-erythritol kinase